jgi:hypothetical protein
MAKVLSKDGYDVYILPSGDVTVTKGAWILVRLLIKASKFVVIDVEAPALWVQEAKTLAQQVAWPQQ